MKKNIVIVALMALMGAGSIKTSDKKQINIYNKYNNEVELSFDISNAESTFDQLLQSYIYTSDAEDIKKLIGDIKKADAYFEKEDGTEIDPKAKIIKYLKKNNIETILLADKSKLSVKVTGESDVTNLTADRNMKLSELKRGHGWQDYLLFLRDVDDPMEDDRALGDYPLSDGLLDIIKVKKTSPVTEKVSSILLYDRSPIKDVPQKSSLKGPIRNMTSKEVGQLKFGDLTESEREEVMNMALFSALESHRNAARKVIDLYRTGNKLPKIEWEKQLAAILAG